MARSSALRGGDELLDGRKHRRRHHDGLRNEQGQVLNDVQQMQLRAELGGERRSVSEPHCAKIC